MPNKRQKVSQVDADVVRLLHVADGKHEQEKSSLFVLPTQTWTFEEEEADGLLNKQVRFRFNFGKIEIDTGCAKPNYIIPHDFDDVECVQAQILLDALRKVNYPCIQHSKEKRVLSLEFGDTLYLTPLFLAFPERCFEVHLEMKTKDPTFIVSIQL